MLNKIIVIIIFPLSDSRERHGESMARAGGTKDEEGGVEAAGDGVR